MPTVNLSSVCAHIVRLSNRHEVQPLEVVGLLAVHALCEVDFPKLRVWKGVANEMREMYAN